MSQLNLDHNLLIYVKYNACMFISQRMQYCFKKYSCMSFSSTKLIHSLSNVMGIISRHVKTVENSLCRYRMMNMIFWTLNVYFFYQILPQPFTRLLPNKTVPVILTCGGRSWETTYLGDNAAYQKKFDQRWRAFAEDNMLKVGDACVFELMECSDTSLKFKVQVLRGDFPSILLGDQDGTIDNPIVVE